MKLARQTIKPKIRDVVITLRRQFAHEKVDLKGMVKAAAEKQGLEELYSDLVFRTSTFLVNQNVAVVDAGALSRKAVMRLLAELDGSSAPAECLDPDEVS